MTRDIVSFDKFAVFTITDQDLAHVIIGEDDVVAINGGDGSISINGVCKTNVGPVHDVNVLSTQIGCSNNVPNTACFNGICNANIP